MELSINRREIEVREGLDERNKSNKSRYNGELQRAHDMIKEREAELDLIERQNVLINFDKQSLEEQLSDL